MCRTNLPLDLIVSFPEYVELALVHFWSWTFKAENIYLPRRLLHLVHGLCKKLVSILESDSLLEAACEGHLEITSRKVHAFLAKHLCPGGECDVPAAAHLFDDALVLHVVETLNRLKLCLEVNNVVVFLVHFCINEVMSES